MSTKPAELNAEPTANVVAVKLVLKLKFAIAFLVGVLLIFVTSSFHYEYELGALGLDHLT
jgi:hypothetical protein